MSLGITPTKFNKTLDSLIIRLKWIIFETKLARIRFISQKAYNQDESNNVNYKAILGENIKQNLFE